MLVLRLGLQPSTTVNKWDRFVAISHLPGRKFTLNAAGGSAINGSMVVVN